MMTYTNLFNYTVKCHMTVRMHAEDRRTFDNTPESRLALLGEIMTANPHYRHKWETGLEANYAYHAGSALNLWWRITMDEAEVRIINELEDACMFSYKEPYCVYWRMDREDYEQLAQEALESAMREFGYKK